MTSSRSTFVTIVVYRPGGVPVSIQFFDELSAVLEQAAAYSCPVIVTGDLNLQMDVVGGSDARRLQEVLDTFGLCQSVSGPTYKDGHTLDVVVSRAALPQPTINIRPCDEYSDHSLVLFQLPTATTPSTIRRC